MIVINKKFYHIHRNDTKNNLWHPGAIIDNSSLDFMNEFYEVVEIFPYSVTFDNQPTNLDSVLKFYLSQPTMPDKEIIFQLLKDSARFINEYSILKREIALENVRKEFFPNLPSRKQAIWLCEKNQLEYWKLAIKEKYIVYEVEVKGEIFLSSDSVIPLPGDNYKTTISKAHNYWNYNQDNKSDSNIEYLFVGQLKVIKEIC